MNENHDADPAHEHRRAWALLPWVANGTAGEAQRAMVRAHLEHCGDCRAELEAQSRLRRLVADAPPAVELAAEAGLVRLMGRVDGPLQEQPVPVLAARRRSPLMAAMAAAVVVQAIGLGIMGFHGSGAETDFRTLSQPEAHARAASVLAVPRQDTTMVEWQSLLRAQQLEVVGGPNMVGGFELAAAKGNTLTVDEQLARLRQSPAIRLAEPLMR